MDTSNAVRSPHLRDKSGSPGNSQQVHKNRNLENQRNFRSRRKQYVTELEEKLRKYEREGVAATEKVQQAARTVVAENAALRRIVCNGLGWDEQRLEKEVLRDMISQNASGNTQNSHSIKLSSTTPPTPQVQQSRVCNQALSNTSIAASPVTKTEAGPENGLSSRRASVHSGPTAYPNNAQQPSACAAPLQPLEPTSRNSNHYSGHVNLNPDLMQPNAFVNDSISCEEAVAILCAFTSEANVELALEELGCKPSTTCTISHRALFEKMDTSL